MPSVIVSPSTGISFVGYKATSLIRETWIGSGFLVLRDRIENLWAGRLSGYNVFNVEIINWKIESRAERRGKAGGFSLPCRTSLFPHNSRESSHCVILPACSISFHQQPNCQFLILDWILIRRQNCLVMQQGTELTVQRFRLSYLWLSDRPSQATSIFCLLVNLLLRSALACSLTLPYETKANTVTGCCHKYLGICRPAFILENCKEISPFPPTLSEFISTFETSETQFCIYWVLCIPVPQDLTVQNTWINMLHIRQMNL